MSDDLEDLRKKIDGLDEELLKTLSGRMEVVRAIGRYKKSNNISLRDEQRMQELSAKRIAQANSLDLPKELIAELYELIYKYALALEAEV